MVAALPPEIDARATRVSSQCIATASILSERAARAEMWERGITLVGNILGVLSLLTASVIPISTKIGQGQKDLITILAAVMLVGGPYALAAIVKNPASRYRDFSKYIGNYADKIVEIQSEVRSPRRYERLLEILALAEKNLNDVRVEFPRAVLSIS